MKKKKSIYTIRGKGLNICDGLRGKMTSSDCNVLSIYKNGKIQGGICKNVGQEEKEEWGEGGAVSIIQHQKYTNMEKITKYNSN